MRGTTSTYDIGFQGLTYHDKTASFSTGDSSPVAFLQECLANIAARESEVKAWVVINEIGARKAAAESEMRWRSGTQLSSIDGMPIGVKDLMDTKDMPTQMGCEAYCGHQPEKDAPIVAALRSAGAIILGKTTTTELGGSFPSPTHNPFDAGRSPGGSSSGSAAAVGARMVPVALGSQVGGSIIRPASYCANYALKPSQGAINRGDRQSYSCATFGALAGSLEDMWLVSIEIAKRIGGDPGWLALEGPDPAPAPLKPTAVALIETAGWDGVPEEARDAMADIASQLEAHGVTVLRRADHPPIEAFEQLARNATSALGALVSWEARNGHEDLVARAPDKVSARVKAGLERARKMSAADYQAALRTRIALQKAYAALAEIADGVLLPSSSGPAPVWVHNTLDDLQPPMPTGDIVFNAPSSIIGAPAVTMPLTLIGNMPMGIQFMAQHGQDAYAVAVARWIKKNVSPVAR